MAMYPTYLPPKTVTALYCYAERLERRWGKAHLADDFSGRMIDAVLRYLARLEEQGASLPRNDEFEDLSVRLLQKFWSRNAKRDLARAATRCNIADSVKASDDASASFEPVTGKAIQMAGLVATLVRAGEREDHAWAFVLRHGGYSWDEVASEMKGRLGDCFAVPQLRQWSTRHFDRMRHAAICVIKEAA